MGHTTQVVGSRQEIFSDGDLLVLLRIILNVAVADDATAWLVEAWTPAFEGNAPGVIELDLQSIVADPQKRASLLELLAKAEAELVHWSPAIPLAVLKTRLKVPGWRFFRDYDTNRLLVALSKLRGLVESHN